MSTYDTVAAADQASYLADYGEDATYTPKGSSAKEISVVVTRRAGQRIPGTVQGFAPYMDVKVANDATLGVTRVTVGGDTITIAARQGGTAQAWKVMDIIDQDAGFWTLRLNVNG